MSQAGMSQIKLDQALLSTSKKQSGLLKRLLFGFWPSSIAVSLCLLVCFSLNYHWNATGALGFNNLSGREAVQGSIGAPWCLLLFRFAAAFLTTAVPVLAVLGSKQQEGEERGAQNLPNLGGFEILSTCTVWTWVGMGLYFLQELAVTAWYQLTGSLPSPAYAAVLWVWFEVMYAMAWLVFFACWLVLIPVTYFCLENKDAFKMMMSPFVLIMHNANLVVMEFELIFSRWTVQPEHVIFCIYFGITYVIFSWWLKSQIGFFTYFFLDYDKAGVPSLIVLVLCICVFFWFGMLSASFLK